MDTELLKKLEDDNIVAADPRNAGLILPNGVMLYRGMTITRQNCDEAIVRNVREMIRAGALAISLDIPRLAIIQVHKPFVTQEMVKLLIEQIKPLVSNWYIVWYDDRGDVSGIRYMKSPCQFDLQDEFGVTL